MTEAWMEFRKWTANAIWKRIEQGLWQVLFCENIKEASYSQGQV